MIQFLETPIISCLKKNIGDVEKGDIWLNEILTSLHIDISTYRSKYSEVGADKLNEKNVTFKNALKTIFDKHDT
jgi:hypothetical protein